VRVPRPARDPLRFGFAGLATPTPVSIQPIGRAGPERSRARIALGSRSVVVTFSRTADGARVRLDALHDAPGAWSISLDLRLRPMLVATIRSDSPLPLHWGMDRVVGANPREFFTYAMRWTGRKLTGDTLRRARSGPVERAVSPVLREAAAAMAATLAPELRLSACAFAPSWRARVASVLARDQRGWLAQAARAHPGVVLFGLALGDVEETEDAGVKLLHDVAQGRRLGPALDDAVGAWARALPAWAAPSDLRTRALRGAFAAAAARRGDARARMLAAQKVLVRRAGRWCEPDLLLVPPPLRFAPEDVPPDPEENLRWFRVMKVPGLTVEGRPAPLDTGLAEAFSAFASRHADVIGCVPADLDRATWLAELVAVLRASGRTPSRATDPERLVAQVDVEEVRRRLTEPQPALFAPPGQGAVPPAPVAAEPVAATLAPPAPDWRDAGFPPRADVQSRTISPRVFEPWRSERATVVQIETLHELRLEGARMSNCVASYQPRIERGDFVVLTAKVDGNRITIAVQPCMTGWRLHEWKGFANRRVEPSEIEALRPWMRANGIADSWRAR
jgi:hypothetical protein